MRFQFERANVPNPDNGRDLSCWLPVPLRGIATDAVPAAGAETGDMEIDLDGNTRVVLSSLVGMALIYNSQLLRRIELGHDCGVFALSCESGDPLSDRRFSTDRDPVRIGVIGSPESIGSVGTAERNTGGRLLLLVSEDAERPHIAVQATVDEATPLYLSKIGTEGPVIMSDLGQVADLYSSAHAAVVSDLSPAES